MFVNALKMARSSTKLILRNKAFLIIGVMIPLMATLFINMWYRIPEAKSEEGVYQLYDRDEQIVYQVDFNRYCVKVYDTVMDERTDKICTELNSAGLFQIFRTDATTLSEEDIRKSSEHSVGEDRVNAIVILREDPTAASLYEVGEDERFELFEASLKNALAGSSADYNTPEIAFVSGGGDEVDYYETRNFSYCIAIASLSFVFAGVLVLSTLMSEKKDNIYDRLMLTTANRASYLISKVILVVGFALFQTTIMTLSFIFLVKVDIGISAVQFFVLLFLTGVVFDMLALCVGLYFNSMAAASLVAFVIWSITPLISGAYFDISNASDLYKKMSLLMPQRWALFSVSRFMNGDNSGYSLMLCVTAAYLVIIFMIGIMGLRTRQAE